MPLENAERWREARLSVIAHWRQVLERVGAREERAVLAMASCREGCCSLVLHDLSGKAASAAPAELACRSCPIYDATGGCLGFVGALNHKVLNGQWEEAARLVDEHIRGLTRLDER